MTRAAIPIVLLLLCSAPSARAQNTETRLRQQQAELARIKRERTVLERKMKGLQSSAHDLSAEVANLDRQREVTTRVVRSLEQQLGLINDQVKATTASLVRAEDEAVTKRAILERRLVDIYKRGPLYDFEVLLSAESFGTLVARYKYLHLLALRDRALVRRVEELRTTIRGRRRQLVYLQNSVEENRKEKQREDGRLAALEQVRRGSLVRVQQDTKKTRARLAALTRSERQLNNVIERLEAARRAAAARSPATRSASSISTSDYGRLDWPVEGQILYRFGRYVTPNNTTTRWNGIGIAAPLGTPVRAVAPGSVVLADVMGTYGKTVIVEHGGGDYSVYSSLSRMDVRKGARIAKGQMVGTVGISDPAMQPHLHFEIRHNGPAIDPATWLRARAR